MHRYYMCAVAEAASRATFVLQSFYFYNNYRPWQPAPAFSVTVAFFGHIHLRFRQQAHTLATGNFHVQFRRQLHCHALSQPPPSFSATVTQFGNLHLLLYRPASCRYSKKLLQKNPSQRSWGSREEKEEMQKGR